LQPRSIGKKISDVNAPITEAEEIFVRAAQRAKADGLPYAGAVLPREAHVLATRHNATIVDVRSRFEYDYIGRVPATPLIEWKRWPGGEINAKFLEQLQEQFAKDDILLFLCRSGVRSHSTAVVAADAGFTRAFNILEGFEGDLDESGQRGHLGGWRKAGLPWVQD
jgi:rhodanese-related sulfurtransferase